MRVGLLLAFVVSCGGGGETWIGTERRPVSSDEKAAPDARPRTKRALIKRVLRALRENDADAYLAMLPTIEEIEESCSEEYQFFYNTIGALRRDIREAIDACSQLIDWTRAESVGGRDPDTRRADCDSAVWKLSDVKLLFRVGGKRYRLVIDNPRQFGGVYVVSRGPVCELDEP